MTDRPVATTPRQMLGPLFTLLLAVVPIAISGCPAAAPPASISSDSAQASSGEEKPTAHTPGQQLIPPSISLDVPTEPKVALPLPELPPTPLHEPAVVMSEEHRRTCLLGVGDRLPELALTDLEGTPRSLSSLYGEKLTVVVFWNDRKVFARDQFSRLGIDTDHFHSFGVNVIAVNVGDPPEVVAQLESQYPGGYECLLDQRSESLTGIATDKLPRTYLLDAEGRVLWFDIEYSRATERELENALYWHLLPEGQRFLPTARLHAASGGNISG